MKLIDYAIISGASLDDLQEKVQKFQAERAHASGHVEWYPSGSPFFHQDKAGTWHQAMYGIEQADE